jgi:hypothetical protein
MSSWFAPQYPFTSQIFSTVSSYRRGGQRERGGHRRRNELINLPILNRRPVAFTAHGVVLGGGLARAAMAVGLRMVSPGNRTKSGPLKVSIRVMP